MLSTPVTSQTYKPHEIIIVNDDPSYQYDPSNFESNYVPLVINHTVNKASAARNTGLLHATGDIICFLDDDDIWVPTIFNVKLISSNSSPLVGFSYSHLWLSIVKIISPIDFNQQFPVIFFDLQLTLHRITNISCVAIKSSVLEFVPMFDIYLPRGNDSDFIRQLILFSLCLCSEILSSL